MATVELIQNMDGYKADYHSYHTGNIGLFIDKAIGKSPIIYYTASYTKSRISNQKMKYVLYISCRFITSSTETMLGTGHVLKADATINNTICAKTTFKTTSDSWKCVDSGDKSRTRAKFKLTIECSSTSSTNLSGSIDIYATDEIDGSYNSVGSAKMPITVATDPLTYKVTFDANGGTGAPSSQTKIHGTNLTISSTKPTRESKTDNDTFKITGNVNGGSGYNKIITANRTTVTSYKFKGWSTSASDTTVDYDPGDIYSTNAALTLFAIWEATVSITCTNNVISGLEIPTRNNSVDDTYTIYLNTQGGNSLSNLTADKISTYIFLGWGTSASSTTLLDINTAYNDTITVYAIWKKTTTVETISLPVPTRNSTKEIFTVTLEAQGGSVIPKNITSTKTDSYIFSGWGINTSEVAYVSSYTPSANTTLYAIWHKTSSVTTVQLPTPTRAGYKFVGWSETIEGSIYVDNQYSPSKSTILYAIWVVSGIVHIGRYKGLLFIYHNNKWYQGIPNVYNDGSFKIGG